MRGEYFYSADGELLVVPQEGRLRFCTELGVIDPEPQEVALIPRGLMDRVVVLEGPARGFVCENYGRQFQLPDHGPIGGNCPANRRDFRTPVAAFEDREVRSRVALKWCGQFHATEIGHSPLDVVAWQGNYAPCKYDLRTFCPVAAVLFDHPDPSIFTVLTAPSGLAGTANIDFVRLRAANRTSHAHASARPSRLYFGGKHDRQPWWQEISLVTGVGAILVDRRTFVRRSAGVRLLSQGSVSPCACKGPKMGRRDKPSGPTRRWPDK